MILEVGKKMLEDNKVYVSMLGGFELKYCNKQISENSNRSKKMWNLLAYIITYRNVPILQSEFIDNLWPDEESSNPVNALKTSLFRIRTILEEIATSKEQFIVSSRGSYQWNPAIECVVDVQEFERLCKLASDTNLDDNDRIKYYSEAINLYKGDFLPKLSAELWVIPLATHYHALYLESSKALIELLEKKELYEDMVSYCLEAIKIEGFDEKLHCLLVRAFMRQGNNTAALNHYEKATEILYNNLGVKPSDELRALYFEIIKTQKTLEMNLDRIIDNLKEAEYKPGAFVCDYGIFQEIYRIEARQSTRDGRSVYIALLTVFNSKSELPPLDELTRVMPRLLTSIKDCLRRGDVIAKYSGAQYVIMLPNINYEDGIMVMDRIVNNYYKNNRKSLLQLKYKLSQINIDVKENN